ncbi:MAG: pilus assembly protein PilX [Ruminococcus sp.]|nr:pilus assembly protein PilX [Ruminococcus sp.]
MRRLNAVLGMALLALFLLHAVMGGFQLSGVIPGGSVIMKTGAWVMTAVLVLHTVIGIKLTADTLRTLKKTGAPYFKENKLFWVRRLSGFAIILFVAFHVIIFMGSNDGAYRLHLFAGAELCTQLLLAVTTAVHVLSNVKPALISLGFKSWKDFLADVLIVLCVILLFTGAAFIIYYLRWNVF